MQTSSTADVLPCPCARHILRGRSVSVTERIIGCVRGAGVSCPCHVMSNRHRRNRLPPFVPLYKDTMKTPAWIAMSNGARMLYVQLKWNYNTKLGNHVFISTRDAAKKLGSNRDCVRRWFRELQHYGFIVMISPGVLGVEGRGKAPHWRLTEEWYLGKAPTRDFLSWDGKKCEPKEIISPCPKNGATLVPKVVPTCQA